MAYKNPEAGKIIGYIYDNRGTPAYEKSYYKIESDTGTSYAYKLPEISVNQYDPNAKKIPLYASPVAPTIN